MPLKNTPNYKEINDIMDETMDKALHRNTKVPEPADVMENVYKGVTKRRK